VRRFLPLLVFVGVGCEELTSPPSIPPLYVSAQLVVGDTVQYIFVDRPRSPEEPRGRGLDDAYVSVSDGETTYVFHPHLTRIKVLTFGDTTTKEDSVYLYVAHFSPEPLTTYHLKVIRGGDTAYGVTTTPDTFSAFLVSFDETDSSFSLIDTVFLPQDSSVLTVWLSPEGTSFYYAFVYNEDHSDSLTYYRPPRYLFISFPDSSLLPNVPDSIRAFPPFAYYQAPAFEWGNGNYVVKIWALNEDRYRWGVLDEENLKNAAGFFGAVSQVKITVPVIFQTLRP